MTKSLLSVAVMTFSLTVIFSSCKKNSNKATTDDTSQVSVQSDDQSRLFSETETASNDANIVLEASSSSFTGREMNTQSLICDATVVADSISNPRTITITYNGTNCMGNRSRSGSLIISIASGIRWKNAGATVSLSYKNLKITRLSDNKSVTINGTHTITNVSGGLLINLSNLQSITHTISSSNMSVTFDDGSQRSWQVARQRVFTYNNGIVISTRGTHVEGTNKSIEEWGTTRYGNSFTSSTLEPMVIRQDCNYRLVRGTIKHETTLATVTVTFGLDAAGMATTCPGNSSYYLKAEWLGIGGKTVTVISPY